MNKMRMEETSILTFLTVFLLILLYFNPNLGAQSFGIGDGDGDGPNTIRCKDRERLALLLFKKGIHDENYPGRLSSWGDGDEKKECCNWEGVRCSNRTGHVLALDLHADGYKNHSLAGTISPSLMELHHMKYLDLSRNYFDGSIPLQLGNLSSLQYLNLSGSDGLEVGNLKWLSNLPNLKHLDLSDISLYKFNDFFEIIGRLSKLSTLALTDCNLSPPTLSSLSHINASSSLVSVHLDSNYLTSSIFPWLFNSSSSLLFLDLSYNEINGSIPDSFGKMNTLLHLNLRENHLEHEIPKSFGNLCHLQTLDLSRNNLEGELAFIHNLSSCARFSTKSLKLSGNRFTGQLPDFSIFPSLKALNLAYNQLNGDLAKSIQDLFDLEILDVSSNNLPGIISEPILSNFSKLRILGLSSLALELNSNWVPPFRLQFLDLRACNLGGTKFPKWLQTQRNLSYIDISSAEIYDEIPAWFWKQINTSDLYCMNFSNNQIHGVLPNLSLGWFPIIDLSSNLFHGRLPTIQRFDFLDLSNNKFSGSILPLCDSLSGGILDLSNNQLSGEISNFCLSNWTSLSALNLANNNFSGINFPNLSSSMSTQLQTLDLHNNSFSGELPSGMRIWNSLIFLDLGDNNFSGKLPAWIGQNFTHLKILILRSNKFHGRIPSSLCQLQDLNILDLSHNNMSGMIPQCLNNFTAMARNANLTEMIQVYNLFYVIRDEILGLDRDISWTYIDKAMVVWRGRADEYGRTLVLLRVIDLSSNRLTGNFPDEILNLTGLVSLNLSRNSLSGRLPRDIGHLNELESLDLSGNQFSGEIPTSMSDLHFLSHLDLSYNKLSGKIPPGTQLLGFDASAYAGNEALCGPPLTPNCSSEDPPTRGTPSNETGEDEIRKWFYVGLGSGFVAGFWGFCGVLTFNRAWRYAYFSALNKSFDWLLLKVALLRVRLLQRSQI